MKPKYEDDLDRPHKQQERRLPLSQLTSSHTLDAQADREGMGRDSARSARRFARGFGVLMARGFHYRVHRCYICQHEAVSTDSEGRSVCAVHLEKNYEDRAFEESTRIIDLVGREEYNRLLDLRFPGDDATTTFPSKDYYEWAKATRERLENERCL